MIRFVLFLFAICCALPDWGAAQERHSIFKLDLSHHASSITRLAVFEENEIVVTVGLDRAARYWDLESGELLATSHLPADSGRAGEITAVDVTPSGFVLMAAKPTEFFSNAASSFFISNTSTVSIPYVTGGTDLTVTDIAFDPVNRLIAAVAGDELIIYDAVFSVLSVQRREALYSWADFTADGRLVTVSEDGLVELLSIDPASGDTTAIAQIRTGDQVPFSAAVNPAGDEIAIGFKESSTVEVFALPSGKRVRRLTGNNLVAGAGSLNIVSWAQNTAAGESVLYAGGTAKLGDQNVVVAWKNGAGAGFALPVATDSITHLHGLSDGGVLFASSFPSWGRLLPSDVSHTQSRAPVVTLAYRADARKLDFRKIGQDGGLSTSGDGKIVTFVATDVAGHTQHYRFDVGRMMLTNASGGPGARGPRDSRDGLRLAGFTDRQITVNGNPILDRDGFMPFGHGERKLSVDVSDTRDVALIGADFSLSLVDASGHVLAHRPIPAGAFSVIMLEEQELAVAALGDGTLRWYSLRADSPLVEILSLFVEGTSQTGVWAAWRPDGAFAHSALGGADLGGYAINRVRYTTTGEPVDFASGWIPMEAMYDQFYRQTEVARTLDTPEIWARVGSDHALSNELASYEWIGARPAQICPGASEGNCLDISSGLRPTDLSAVDWTTSDAATVVLFAPAGAAPIARLGLYRNGRIAGSFVAADLDIRSVDNGTEYLVPLELVGGENAFELRAFSPGDHYETVRLPILTLPIELTNQTLHILSVGIAEYAADGLMLLAADNDAREVGEAIYGKPSFDYGEVRQPRTLVNEEATKQRILREIGDIAAEADGNDGVIIYLSGHGEIASDGSYTFASYDVTSFETLFDQGLGGDELTNAIASIKSQNLMLIIDTCYADGFDTDRIGNFAHTLQSYFLMASEEDEQAQDLVDGSDNGALAHVLLEALQGRTDLRTVDALTLGSHVLRQMPDLLGEGAQTPTFRNGDGPLRVFPIVEHEET
ncbi:hypothetical protein So717_36650 [Roseobacter cerasinus]|uniref:Peptidase C14 caspase domain-containing protein n=1 Tax=Roseobacter cerasinus TaxID=2602289 RepID=A0A640VWA5_9RHOB|nr:caspase family protein [Roseobacter cerasinus]GFE51912.1 hypothetical protein So717_36650 [Roseobacter cerasinus]